MQSGGICGLPLFIGKVSIAVGGLDFKSLKEMLAVLEVVRRDVKFVSFNLFDNLASGVRGAETCFKILDSLSRLFADVIAHASQNSRKLLFIR